MKNISVLTSVLVILLLASCAKIEKKTMNAEEAQTLLIESVTAFSIYTNTQEESTRTSSEIETSLKSGSIAQTGYPIVTVDKPDLTTWPKTITIDYGPTNITGWDGVQRRGVLVIDANNFPSVTNAVWTISFDEYFHNDFKVEGTQTITYNGKNASDHPVYTCKITDGKITSPEEKEFYFEQNTTREWIAGNSTPLNICDDEYLISGTHSGVSSDGYVYEMTTPEALHIQICCHWVMEGRLSVNLSDSGLLAEINYRPESDTGDLCNNKASFTIFGEEYDITLP